MVPRVPIREVHSTGDRRPDEANDQCADNSNHADDSHTFSPDEYRRARAASGYNDRDRGNAEAHDDSNASTGARSRERAPSEARSAPPQRKPRGGGSSSESQPGDDAGGSVDGDRENLYGDAGAGKPNLRRRRSLSDSDVDKYADKAAAAEAAAPADEQSDGGGSRRSSTAGSQHQQQSTAPASRRPSDVQSKQAGSRIPRAASSRRTSQVVHKVNESEDEDDDEDGEHERRSSKRVPLVSPTEKGSSGSQPSSRGPLSSQSGGKGADAETRSGGFGAESAGSRRSSAVASRPPSGKLRTAARVQAGKIESAMMQEHEGGVAWEVPAVGADADDEEEQDSEDGANGGRDRTDSDQPRRRHQLQFQDAQPSIHDDSLDDAGAAGIGDSLNLSASSVERSTSAAGLRSSTASRELLSAARSRRQASRTSRSSESSNQPTVGHDNGDSNIQIDGPLDVSLPHPDDHDGRASITSGGRNIFENGKPNGSGQPAYVNITAIGPVTVHTAPASNSPSRPSSSAGFDAATTPQRKREQLQPLDEHRKGQMAYQTLPYGSSSDGPDNADSGSQARDTLAQTAGGSDARASISSFNGDLFPGPSQQQQQNSNAGPASMRSNDDAESEPGTGTVADMHRRMQQRVSQHSEGKQQDAESAIHALDRQDSMAFGSSGSLSGTMQPAVSLRPMEPLITAHENHSARENPQQYQYQQQVGSSGPVGSRSYRAHEVPPLAGIGAPRAQMTSSIHSPPHGQQRQFNATSAERAKLLMEEVANEPLSPQSLAALTHRRPGSAPGSAGGPLSSTGRSASRSRAPAAIEHIAASLSPAALNSSRLSMRSPSRNSSGNERSMSPVRLMLDVMGEERDQMREQVSHLHQVAAELRESFQSAQALQYEQQQQQQQDEIEQQRQQQQEEMDRQQRRVPLLDLLFQAGPSGDLARRGASLAISTLSSIHRKLRLRSALARWKALPPRALQISVMPGTNQVHISPPRGNASIRLGGGGGHGMTIGSGGVGGSAAGGGGGGTQIEFGGVPISFSGTGDIAVGMGASGGFTIGSGTNGASQIMIGTGDGVCNGQFGSFGDTGAGFRSTGVVSVAPSPSRSGGGGGTVIRIDHKDPFVPTTEEGVNTEATARQQRCLSPPRRVWEAEEGHFVSTATSRAREAANREKIEKMAATKELELQLTQRSGRSKSPPVLPANRRSYELSRSAVLAMTSSGSSSTSVSNAANGRRPSSARSTGPAGFGGTSTQSRPGSPARAQQHTSSDTIVVPQPIRMSSTGITVSQGDGQPGLTLNIVSPSRSRSSSIAAGTTTITTNAVPPLPMSTTTSLSSGPIVITAGGTTVQSGLFTATASLPQAAPQQQPQQQQPQAQHHQHPTVTVKSNGTLTISGIPSSGMAQQQQQQAQTQALQSQLSQQLLQSMPALTFGSMQSQQAQQQTQYPVRISIGAELPPDMDPDARSMAVQAILQTREEQIRRVMGAADEQIVRLAVAASSSRNPTPVQHLQAFDNERDDGDDASSIAKSVATQDRGRPSSAPAGAPTSARAHVVADLSRTKLKKPTPNVQRLNGLPQMYGKYDGSWNPKAGVTNAATGSPRRTTGPGGGQAFWVSPRTGAGGVTVPDNLTSRSAWDGVAAAASARGSPAAAGAGYLYEPNTARSRLPSHAAGLGYPGAPGAAAASQRRGGNGAARDDAHGSFPQKRKNAGVVTEAPLLEYSAFLERETRATEAASFDPADPLGHFRGQIPTKTTVFQGSGPHASSGLPRHTESAASGRIAGIQEELLYPSHALDVFRMAASPGTGQMQMQGSRSGYGISSPELPSGVRVQAAHGWTASSPAGLQHPQAPMFNIDAFERGSRLNVLMSDVGFEGGGGMAQQQQYPGAVSRPSLAMAPRQQSAGSHPHLLSSQLGLGPAAHQSPQVAPARTVSGPVLPAHAYSQGLSLPLNSSISGLANLSPPRAVPRVQLGLSQSRPPSSPSGRGHAVPPVSLPLQPMMLSDEIAFARQARGY